MGKAVNKVELAEILTVSERTLTTWQEDPLFPIKFRGERGESNEYDTGEVIAWWIEREKGKIRVENPKDRLARLQSDEIELRLQERRGVLIPAGAVEPAWASLVGAARSYLRSESRGLAESCHAAGDLEKMVDLITEVHDEFLTKLSTADLSDDESAEGVPEVHFAFGAAPEDDGGGVGGETPAAG